MAGYGSPAQAALAAMRVAEAHEGIKARRLAALNDALRALTALGGPPGGERPGPLMTVVLTDAPCTNCGSTPHDKDDH